MQALYNKDLGKHRKKLLAWTPFLLKLRSSNVFTAILFWKFANILGQHVKSWFWKIV